MTRIRIRPALAAFIAALGLCGMAAAQSSSGGAGAPAPAAAAADTDTELAEGEVRKVDKESKKLTLRHGPLKNLDMPGMTMVFQVRDAALLDKVQAGDKVRFSAEKIDGKFTVKMRAEGLQNAARFTTEHMLQSYVATYRRVVTMRLSSSPATDRERGSSA